MAETRPARPGTASCLLLAYSSPTRSISVNRTQARANMADFTKEWIEHLKGQIASRLSIAEDKMDPQTYDQLVTDLAWFTFRFARDPDTKMRKIFR